MTVLLGAIAGISLLVGGIGIMNIMYVFSHRKNKGNRTTYGNRWKRRLTF